jgi:hypothetical protein
VGSLKSVIEKWAFGVYFTHPAIFVGSIVSAVLLKMGSDRIEYGQMLTEIDKITDYFTIITSNLMAHYLYACDTITESFMTKDS